MSKQLNLTIEVTDLKLKPEAGGTLPNGQEIFKRVITVVINQYAQQIGGLSKPERKQSRWLCDELEKAAATEAKELEVPDDIFGFLRKIFRETRLPGPDKSIDRVEANIDAVKME